MKYHIISLILGFCLDLLLGDPYWLPHPVRLLGKEIEALEVKLLGSKRGATDEPVTGLSPKEQLGRGMLLVALVLVGTGLVSGALWAGAYRIHPLVGVATESLLIYQMLAVKCLGTESGKVCRALQEGDVEKARQAVSMLVGRDTALLDEEGIARAAVETVAENTSDGAIAPILCAALGGPLLLFLYKAVNTMDSMVGYKNQRYLYFGRAAARLDDGVNFIPARISALLMLGACLADPKKYSVKNGWRIFKRDRYCHASPNSAHTEAVCAGALGIRLGGDASYFGRVVSKPVIGDAVREIEAGDILLANKLLYVSSLLCVLLACGILGVIAAVQSGGLL